ncbi:MAG: hypothetical protein HEP71_06985 [Roseivirga sp.]|nr:hypothetical protein [Roseivirga sp.]
MKRSKKIFVAVGAVFIIGVCLVTYDIFTRTSLPGSKKYLKESILPSGDSVDSPNDSIKTPSDSADVIDGSQR